MTPVLFEVQGRSLCTHEGVKAGRWVRYGCSVHQRPLLCTNLSFLRDWYTTEVSGVRKLSVVFQVCSFGRTPGSKTGRNASGVHVFTHTCDGMKVGTTDSGVRSGTNDGPVRANNAQNARGGPRSGPVRALHASSADSIMAGTGVQVEEGVERAEGGLDGATLETSVSAGRGDIGDKRLSARAARGSWGADSSTAEREFRPGVTQPQGRRPENGRSRGGSSRPQLTECVP